MGKPAIIILVVIGVLLISGLVYAKYRGFCGTPDQHADWIVKRIGKRLDLDESQQLKLNGLRDKALDLMQQMRDERVHNFDEVLALLDSPQLNREQAYRLWDAKQNWIATAGPQLIDAFVDFSDSLHSEQRNKLQAMIMQHHRSPHSRCCDTTRTVEQE